MKKRSSRLVAALAVAAAIALGSSETAMAGETSRSLNEYPYSKRH